MPSLPATQQKTMTGKESTNAQKMKAQFQICCYDLVKKNNKTPKTIILITKVRERGSKNWPGKMVRERDREQGKQTLGGKFVFKHVKKYSCPISNVTETKTLAREGEKHSIPTKNESVKIGVC